jgi:hypothetical protein
MSAESKGWVELSWLIAVFFVWFSAQIGDSWFIGKGRAEVSRRSQRVTQQLDPYKFM